MSARLCLVTGATGLLCSEVVRRLVARGDEVHALARKTADKSVLQGVDVHWHEGDLTDAASLESACWKMAERSFVSRRAWDLVHGAALISYKSKDRAQALAINVEGTRQVLEAARKSGVARVVHVSSVVTVAVSVGDETLDESAAFNLADCGVDYVTTKRAGEEIALAMARDLDLVVVNPGAIFGAAERSSNIARFIRLVALGKGPLGGPSGDDRRARRGGRGRGDDPRARPRTAGRTLSAGRKLDHVARAVRRGREPIRPAWAAAHDPARRLARVVDRARTWDRFFPIDLAPPQGLVMLARDLRFDASKARRELGWSPRPFDEVLKSTIANLAARGLLAERE